MIYRRQDLQIYSINKHTISINKLKITTGCENKGRAYSQTLPEILCLLLLITARCLACQSTFFSRILGRELQTCNLHCKPSPLWLTMTPSSSIWRSFALSGSHSGSCLLTSSYLHWRWAFGFFGNQNRNILVHHAYIWHRIFGFSQKIRFRMSISNLHSSVLSSSEKADPNEGQSAPSMVKKFCSVVIS